MDAFFGSWKLVSCTNFDELMEAMGLSPSVRQYGNNMTSVVIFSQDGDNIVMKIKTYETTTKSVTLSFKLGEEFDENTIDFRYCKTVMNLEGGKLIQLQKWDGKEVTTICEVQDGTMTATLTFGDVTSVHTYEKI
ncbi:fatty acid-binding protein, brain [Ictalurus punctatus]|uniref:Fatty acid-binding protein, brain n=1 Tax=Ictalurus punctatus TaxID=7998 RepID=A0A2D0Q171_ICTPU|nr:fatty acid-binding protein, brain [Ictalurus punctatus]